MIYDDTETFQASLLSPDAYLVDPDMLDQDFITIYMKSVEFTEMLVDRSVVDAIHTAYLASVSHLSGDTFESFPDVEQQVWAWTGYHPTVTLFRRLEFYGIQGLHHYNDAESPADSSALRQELETAERFHEALPANWLKATETAGKGRFGEILHCAQARYALDSGEDLTIGQIVVLSGLNRRSVLNALSAPNETRLRSVDGIVPHAEARRWLQARRNFTPTTRYTAPDDEDVEIVSPGEPVEYIFIPEALDGTQFRPEHRRSNGYQIGGKGEEQYVDDYREALALLQSMPTPRWRRPNEQDNWGIVTARAWIRVPLDELKLN